MGCLGIPELRFSSRTRGGGGGACATVQHAAAAVESGQADAVLIWRAFNERSGRRFGQPEPASTRPGPELVPAVRAGHSGQDLRAHLPAVHAPLRAHQRRLRPLHASWPASTRRRTRAAWFYERPITLADHQASRWIVEPLLRLLDCCQESDGGVALVVTRADRAPDLPTPPVRVAAAAASQVLGGDEMFNYYHPDLTRFVESEATGRQLYARSRARAPTPSTWR